MVIGTACNPNIPDPEHSEFEARYIDLGLSDKGRLLTVVYDDTNT